MRVIEWIPYGVAVEHLESAGGIGGWFGHTDDWATYVSYCSEAERPYIDAIKADVLESGRFIGGDEHQDDPEGVPLFEDETVALFSYRGWGDLMAAIATEKFGRSFSYMDFYMRATMPAVLA